MTFRTVLTAVHTVPDDKFQQYLQNTNQTEELFMQRSSEALVGVLSDLLFGQVEVTAVTERTYTHD